MTNANVVRANSARAALHLFSVNSTAYYLLLWIRAESDSRAVTLAFGFYNHWDPGACCLLLPSVWEIDEKMVRLFGQICEQLNIDLEESARSHAVLICF